VAGSRRAAVVDRDHRLPHRRGAVPDRRRPPGDVVVVAVGSHEPDAREVDAPLLGRATVVVEDVGTALREAGDVVLAIAEAG
jgi:hypothetical protein